MAEDIAERSVVSWSMADKHNRATQRLGAYGSVRYQSAKRHMADGFAKQGLSRIAYVSFMMVIGSDIKCVSVLALNISTERAWTRGSSDTSVRLELGCSACKALYLTRVFSSRSRLSCLLRHRESQLPRREMRVTDFDHAWGHGCLSYYSIHNSGRLRSYFSTYEMNLDLYRVCLCPLYID